jgi:hypothetical protein
MPHIHSTSSKPVTAALVLLLACVSLAACGSSSNSSTSTKAQTSSSASATTPTGHGPVAGRFAAFRECLRKNGITLPKRTPGQRPSPGTGGGFLGGAGGPTLPKGVTRAQYQAALKKCGAPGGGAFFGGHGGRFSSPAVKQALAKFAACMDANGVKVPAPNTSGSGPIFDIKGVNQSSAAFRAAEAKCRGDLQGAFRVRPGGAPGGPPTSAG